MKLACSLFVFATLAAGASARTVSQETPIQKVVVLVQDLAKKIEKEGKTEQASYDKYACWVEDTLARKGTDIEKAKDLLKKLGQSIVKLKAEIASHGAEIAQLNKDLAQNKAAMKDATGVRNKESKEYMGDRTESEQCIGAMEAAIKVLTGAGTKAGFLQQVEEAELMSVTMGVRKAMRRASAHMTDEEMQVVNRFVQQPQSFALNGMSAAQTGQNPFGDYAPQSTQIQGILKGMYDAFTADLEKDNAEEAKSQKSFEELMATKKQERATLTATLQKQETDSAAKTKKLAEDEVLKDDTTDQLAADVKFFEETKDAAEKKATEWSERTRMRTEELAGMAGAVEILNGGMKTLTEASTTFVQLKAVSRHEDKHAAYHQLRKLAAKYQTASLAQVVSVMKSGGHFDKVFIMIDHMMALLREEEQEDIKHRDRCENGENANKNEMEDAESAIKKTEKQLKRMENEHKEKRKEISDVEGEIVESKNNLKEMLKLRNEEHAKFVRAVQMDTEAISLIGAAVVRLSEYYKKEGISLGLVQAPEYASDPDTPPATDFSGKDAHQGESTNIVAIMEMIKEDMQKEIKEGKADEAEAQAEYEKQSGAAQDSLNAQKETKVALEKELANLEEGMSSKEKYKKDKQSDLDSEKDMQKSLQTDCKWVKTHFEKRRSARKKEMDGLVEAKSFLAGVESGDAVLAPGL